MRDGFVELRPFHASSCPNYTVGQTLVAPLPQQLLQRHGIITTRKMYHISLWDRVDHTFALSQN